MTCALAIAVPQLFLILCLSMMRVGRYFNACRFSILALVAVVASATHFVAVIVFSHRDGFHNVIFAVESIRDQLLNYDRVWRTHAD